MYDYFISSLRNAMNKFKDSVSFSNEAKRLLYLPYSVSFKIGSSCSGKFKL